MSVAGELVDRIGVRLHATRNDTAILPVSPGVIREGEFLAAGLMLAADIASGVRLHDPDVAMVLTTSFSFRRATPRPAGPVTAVATQLFHDGRRAVDRVDFRDDANRAIATALISFAVRRDDAAEVMAHDRGGIFRAPWTNPIQNPLIEAAGIATVNAANGHVAIRATSDVRRKIGILQGSMVTLLGEAGAIALAEHHYGSPAVVDALDIDFLAPASADDFATSGRWLDAPGTSDIEVVLRSEPQGSVVAVFLVGVARANNR